LTPCGSFLTDEGSMQRVKPMRAASEILLSTCGTERSSPLNPSSPTATVPGMERASLKLEAIASATPRSAAGSEILIPPVTFTITSWL
jgi:hypothetical protein